MRDMETCPGPLFRFPTPVVDDAGQPVALVECGACGEVFVTVNPLDERHQDTLCLA